MKPNMFRLYYRKESLTYFAEGIILPLIVWTLLTVIEQKTGEQISDHIFTVSYFLTSLPFFFFAFRIVFKSFLIGLALAILLSYGLFLFSDEIIDLINGIFTKILN